MWARACKACRTCAPARACAPLPAPHHCVVWGGPPHAHLPTPLRPACCPPTPQAFGREVAAGLLHLHTSTPHLLVCLELFVPAKHAALMAASGLIPALEEDDGHSMLSGDSWYSGRCCAVLDALVYILHVLVYTVCVRL